MVFSVITFLAQLEVNTRRHHLPFWMQFLLHLHPLFDTNNVLDLSGAISRLYLDYNLVLSFGWQHLSNEHNYLRYDRWKILYLKIEQNLRDKRMLSMEHMTSREHKSACRISFHQSGEASQYISGQYKLQLRLFLFSVFLLFSNPKYLLNLQKK